MDIDFDCHKQKNSRDEQKFDSDNCDFLYDGMSTKVVEFESVVTESTRESNTRSDQQMNIKLLLKNDDIMVNALMNLPTVDESGCVFCGFFGLFLCQFSTFMAVLVVLMNYSGRL